MSNEGSKNNGYRAYLIRLWQVCSDGQMVWRASAEDAHSGERRAFADLAHLFAFLEGATLSGRASLLEKAQPDD